MLSIQVRATARCGAIYIAAALFFSLAFFSLETAAAQQRKPLLLTGKRTLFQRVVTHPGARLFASAGDSAPVLDKWIIPFTVFYVYQRASVDGTQWLEVGLSSTGEVDGWIKGAKVSEWRQSLTLKFTERAGRQPVLFFKDMQSLDSVAASADRGKSASQLPSQFTDIKSGSKKKPADFSAGFFLFQLRNQLQGNFIRFSPVFFVL